MSATTSLKSSKILTNSRESVNRDLNWLKFGGTCVAVAEEDLAASLNDCTQSEHEKFIEGLYAMYISAGEPKNTKGWLREHLRERFRSVGDRPRWVEGKPAWPWLDGKPMVFLGEFQVLKTETAREHATPGVTLYVFGARVPTTGGWRMEYKVVEQRAELEGLIAVAESEELPHTTANTKLAKRTNG